jgi:lysine-specific demethylase 8
MMADGLGAFCSTGLFLDAFLLDRVPTGNSSMDIVGFLAQYDLFEKVIAATKRLERSPLLIAITMQIPELNQQAPCLDLAVSGGPKGQFWRRNVWIGPSGTFSPIHRDPYHNLYCQGGVCMSSPRAPRLAY